jgi:hypothetical protein
VQGFPSSRQPPPPPEGPPRQQQIAGEQQVAQKAAQKLSAEELPPLEEPEVPELEDELIPWELVAVELEEVAVELAVALEVVVVPPLDEPCDCDEPLEPPLVAALPLELAETKPQKPLTHCWSPGQGSLFTQAIEPLPPELLPCVVDVPPSGEFEDEQAAIAAQARAAAPSLEKSDMERPFRPQGEMTSTLKLALVGMAALSSLKISHLAPSYQTPMGWAL